MKQWTLYIIILLTLCTTSYAANPPYHYGSVKSNGKKYLSDTKTFKVLHVGVPIAAVGLVLRPVDSEFRNLHDNYVYGAHTHVDDYLQYAPVGLMLGLKAAGVESRSSWGRMLASDAISMAAMTLVVNGLKISTSVTRPDSQADNSFPSGHTATAFMAATMLHKEYGGRSPWYSIAGYSAATATGMMRVVNNRHWISDVLVGAGVGIISTEIGYMLADLIFRNRGINRELDGYEEDLDWQEVNTSTSLSLEVGALMSLGTMETANGKNLKIATGSSIAIEGSHLFDKGFGIGGKMALSTSAIRLDGKTQYDELNIVSGRIGGYYARPVSPRWRVGAKAFAGVNYYKDCMPCEEFKIEKGAKPAIGTGFTVEYLTNRYWSMKIFCNYDAAYIKEFPSTNFHQTILAGASGSIVF